MEIMTQTVSLWKWRGWVTAAHTGTMFYFGWILTWGTTDTCGAPHHQKQPTMPQKAPVWKKNESWMVWTEGAASRTPPSWDLFPCSSTGMGPGLRGPSLMLLSPMGPSPMGLSHVPQPALTLPAYFTSAKNTPNYFQKNPKLPFLQQLKGQVKKSAGAFPRMC